VLLGLEGERVDVDADGRDVRVVLVRLDPVEVRTLTNLEPIVTVELEERRDYRVLASHALNTRDGVARLKNRAVPPVRVVEGLLALPAVDDRVVARRERITLNNPDKLLARVVEVELELVGRRRDGLLARELERLDEVLVGNLGELAALVRVKVDVVNVERRGDKVRRVDTLLDDVGVRANRGVVPAEVLERVELEVNANLVVLERNKGECKTRVAVEPELEGDVERVLGRATENLAERIGLTAGAGGVARLTAVDKEVC